MLSLVSIKVMLYSQVGLEPNLQFSVLNLPSAAITGWATMPSHELF